jgi:hypothetical protein
MQIILLYEKPLIVVFSDLNAISQIGNDDYQNPLSIRAGRASEVTIWPTTSPSYDSIYSTTPVGFGEMMEECSDATFLDNFGGILPFFDLRIRSYQPYVATLCQIVEIVTNDSSTQLTWSPYTGSQYDLNLTVGQYVDSYNASGDAHPIWLDPPSAYRDKFSIFAIVAGQNVTLPTFCYARAS